MEYYLAVRMRRFGRAFQSSEPTGTPERPSERGIGRSAGAAPNGGIDPVVAGVSTTTSTPPRLAVRPVGRPGSRPPGRY
jgi:hypothetical protein